MPPRRPLSAARVGGCDGALGVVAARRLHNLGLAAPAAAAPASIVDAFGAIQAQDYAGARWAVAVRTPALTEDDVERAFDTGSILRTHVLRPTWHFVVPAKIHDLLALTAARVHAANAGPYRQCGIDAALRRRSQRIMARALEGGRHLSRAELGRVLERAGFRLDARRTTFLAMAAELDGVICSGPRRRGEFTYALLHERAPGRAAPVERALEDLARRYFGTHGPATLRDFAWWSGLTVAHGRQAVEMLGAALVAERIGERTYYSTPATAPIHPVTGTAHLLAAFDEFVVAYRDREAVPYGFSGPNRPMPYLNSFVAGGQIAGTWGRVRRAREVRLEIVAARRLTRRERESLELAVARYARFLQQPVRASVRGAGGVR